LHHLHVTNVNDKFTEREGTKVSNALECGLQYWANRKVFNWRRKLSIESSGSRRYSGKLFQVPMPLLMVPVLLAFMELQFCKLSTAGGKPIPIRTYGSAV